MLVVFRKWETPTRESSAMRGAKNNATKFPPEATSLREGSVYTPGVCMLARKHAQLSRVEWFMARIHARIVERHSVVLCTTTTLTH